MLGGGGSEAEWQKLQNSISMTFGGDMNLPLLSLLTFPLFTLGSAVRPGAPQTLGCGTAHFGCDLYTPSKFALRTAHWVGWGAGVVNSDVLPRK